ncbi:MAG: hypothetical protein DRQ56_06945 [Gammaproteobacteria bacterium]|nr:MAG: hypothetical protein DRQ56_06945 [Gammaproteobacteria bacterium]
MNPTECKHTLTIDYETFYSREYSLSKMTTQEYIYNDQFDAICVAVKLDNERTRVYAGGWKDTKKWLSQFPWDESCLIAHNAMFDGAILEWIHKLKPKAYFCTMMGSRPNLVPYTKNGRMGLGAVAEYLGIGTKGNTLLRTIGKSRLDLVRDGTMLEFLTYCVNDVDLCYDIYKAIIPNMPAEEQFMLSLTIRKYVRPKLTLDWERLHGALNVVRKDKAAHLERIRRDINVADLDQVKKKLMSNNLFAGLLRDYGVIPPMKISPTTGKETYAFAKADPDFQALLEHKDLGVRTLVEARIGTKSTQEETRLQRFIKVGDTTIEGTFAVPLTYYGAHTGRFAGQDKLNLQNLKRGSNLRYAIEAPPGHDLVVADLSQVEARITAALCGQENLNNSFTMGLDVYSVFASELFNMEVSKNTPKERFIGKQCILGLGFNMSWRKFQSTMRTFGTDLPDQQAKGIVYFYRDKHRQIVETWGYLDNCVEVMARGDVHKWGPVIFMNGRCVLPNGMQLHYPDLQRNYRDAKDNLWEGWTYNYRGKRKNIYGGALLENIVQALARIILVSAECLLGRRGWFAALSVHDELIYACEKSKAPLLERALTLALTRQVPYLPSLTLACESDTGENYGVCK